MRADFAIIIFVKFPQEGKVKTRLAKDKGAYFATEFYRICAEHILSEIKKLNKNNFASYIYCYSNSEVEMVSGWIGREFIVKPQIDGDLGERMSKSFNEVFNEGFSKVLIIGTDVPDINSDLINNAASKLDENDFVIGPSSDGGYYLLGMNSLNTEIFHDLNWSTSFVLKNTLDKINSLKLKTNLLEELIDVDTKKDLNSWMKLCNDLNNPIYKFVSDYNKGLK
jgi:rSAM/selenodomain-associated transferase 1